MAEILNVKSCVGFRYHIRKWLFLCRGRLLKTIDKVLVRFLYHVVMFAWETARWQTTTYWWSTNFEYLNCKFFSYVEEGKRFGL